MEIEEYYNVDDYSPTSFEHLTGESYEDYVERIQDQEDFVDYLND